ncbi:hypothetical protein GWI33_013108 [Rhynchophorus ferrugineus]|uniref:Uncharacterized protein n=1 Tax=Rhynchophorus ferrugineus TaxID=354439 RepID=A0A834MBV7_RHYFE|nr:hypothetical protein GWI33_013108 [Rhynchophorus ferrugineus]
MTSPSPPPLQSVTFFPVLSHGVAVFRFLPSSVFGPRPVEQSGRLLLHMFPDYLAAVEKRFLCAAVPWPFPCSRTSGTGERKARRRLRGTIRGDPGMRGWFYTDRRDR